jgi:hypothetical protein
MSEPAWQSLVSDSPTATSTRNWLALSLVAPAKDGAALNVPSAAVVVVAVRMDALPPGGIGAPLRKACTVTVTGTPAPRPVLPATSATPDTKSNEAVKVPATPPSTPMPPAPGIRPTV